MPANRDLDLDALYRAHHPRVLNLCRHLLQSAAEAEDAAQEVFLRARQRVDRYDPARPFGSWVLGIAAHHCLDRLRRRRTERRLFAAEEIDLERAACAAARTSPIAALVSGERRRALQRAVAALPSKYRVPLVLAYYGECRHQEIAALLDLTRGHVAVLIHRARQELRRALAAPSGGRV